jgi:hypothetical protein
MHLLAGFTIVNESGLYWQEISCSLPSQFKDFGCGQDKELFMGVQARQIQLFTKIDLATGQPNTQWCEEIRMWAINNAIPNLDIRVYEVVEWDIARMRSFLHGVVLPAFVTKFNETCSAGRQGIFNKDIVKEFLKAKHLGFVKDSNYDRWEPVLGLVCRPVDILDWLKLVSLLTRIKDPVVPISTETLSAERYWDFLNICEKYYFELFHDMYQVRAKPVLENKS